MKPIVLRGPIAVGFIASLLVCLAAPCPAQKAAPAGPKGKPAGAPEYAAHPPADAGKNLALTIKKLEHGFDPPRPFLVWAIGSSYTNFLGDGVELEAMIRQRFPNAPKIEYHKMVGNSVTWQYIRGWARHIVVPAQPDLVLTYTIGDAADLDKLLAEVRRATTADIIVPSIHWRERDADHWGKDEDAADQKVQAVREVCAKYGAEFVDSRRGWAEYLKANNLQIPDLLRDAVHQSDYGRQIILRNIASHVRAPEVGGFSYSPDHRERRVKGEASGGAIKLEFTGSRVDVVAARSADGPTLSVVIDGKPADQLPIFYADYVQPGKKNYASAADKVVPRDSAPHAVGLGSNLVAQAWTITMTSGTGDYELTGSVTGKDGTGNSKQKFTSRSGQIIVEPELWRRGENNRAGDTFTFEVKQTGIATVNFRGAGEKFVERLAWGLPNGKHTLELRGPGPLPAVWLDVYEPPLK